MNTHRPDLSGPDAAQVFTAVFDRYAPAVLRYLRLHVRDAEAEDLLSETFCQAWEVRDRYDADLGVCSAWLFGIAAHLLSRHKRSWIRGRRADDRLVGQSTVVTDSHEGRVVDRLDAGTAAARLAAALADLHDYDREVLVLASAGDLGMDDIARIVQVPVGTVRSRLHRARRQLRGQAAVLALLDHHGDLS